MGIKKLRVGTRRSQLALVQTEYVIKELTKICSFECEIVKIDTIGDNILDIPLPKIGEKALFTRELEVALELHQIDIVVHSLKDLPTTLPSKLVIGAILKRVCSEDVVIINTQKHSIKNIELLPNNSIIGTSSLRRMAQIRHTYPHLIVKDIRGNINTRIRKLDEGQFDAIILASAGLQRLNWEDKIAQQGGCSAPVGVRTILKEIDGKISQVTLCGMVSDLEGKERLVEKFTMDLYSDNINRETLNSSASNRLANKIDKKYNKDSAAHIITGIYLNPSGSSHIDIKDIEFNEEATEFPNIDMKINTEDSKKRAALHNPDDKGNDESQLKNHNDSILNKEAVNENLVTMYLNAEKCGHTLAEMMLNQGALEILTKVREGNL
ncbi:porphobilinogen deaminase-like isoform X2 [Gordionus sp. m RMFG-2023]|uniref:porphobilinogen deaminase-like isoform X2 n=1 Tax=Gordionus sp. m RMFG-2023 TaxID=3053472 RepID=UPI0031FCDEA5